MRKYFLPVALSLLVACATVLVAIDARDDSVPPAIDSRLVVASIVILAFGALSTSTRSIRMDLRQENSLLFRRKLERRLAAVLVTLHQEHVQTEWYRIGLHVWMIPRWYRAITPRYAVRSRLPQGVRRRLRSPTLTPRLQRRGKLRLQEVEHPTGIAWRRGRGVIGKCWDTRVPAFFNGEREYAPYRDHTEGQWASVPNSVRMNLRFKEFARINDRYGDVIAVPIFVFRNEGDEHPDVVGCLAFDTPIGCHETKATLEDIVLPILLSGADRMAEVINPTRA